MTKQTDPAGEKFDEAVTELLKSDIECDDDGEEFSWSKAWREEALVTIRTAADTMAAERVREYEGELLNTLDDIANKPWRAMRHLAELFEQHPENDYYAECAKEYRKLAEFYSQGGFAALEAKEEK